MSMRQIAFLAIALFLAASTARAQAAPKPDAPEFDVKEHYTKYEVRIPMRDGVRLFTAVYVPKDSSRPYPFLINRTPYSISPYGVDQYRTQLGPSPDFDKAGYIFVMQDVRGRFMSEGKFIEMRPHIDIKKSTSDVDDSSDLYDTIDWLLENIPNNKSRHLGYFLSRVFHFRQHDRHPSGAQSRLASSSASISHRNQRPTHTNEQKLVQLLVSCSAPLQGCGFLLGSFL
jgi:hypothetical protein